MYLTSIRLSYTILKSIIITKVSRIRKLIKLIDSLEMVESNDTIYININKHILLNHTGNMVLHSDAGYLITKHSKTHINPAIRINIIDTMDNVVRANNKALLLEKQTLYSRLLKHNKKHSKIN